MAEHNTEKEFNDAIAECKEVFVKKLKDYGASWRILRPTAVTDQILIKANRIRTLETKKEAMVDEGILPEFKGIVNYGIIGLIQLELGMSDTVDISNEEAIRLYDRFVDQTTKLMLA